MAIDIFSEARRMVSAEDAARLYGVRLDRHGRALCPFHNDRHPSMTFKNGYFRCWSCGAAGSAIDLTARLFGLDALGAVRRLNQDFSLALPLDSEPTREERQKARHRQEVASAYTAFEDWRGGFILKLCAAFREGHFARMRLERLGNMDGLTEREALAIRMNAIFEYWADTLSYGDPRDQAQIFRERGQIAQWIEKVLKVC